MPAATADLAQGFARRRLYRLMSVSLSITAVVEVASIVPAMFAQAPLLTWTWTIATAAMATAPAIIGLLVFRWASIRVLRTIWRVQAGGMLAVYVAMPVALAGQRVSVTFGLTWAAELEIIPACAAILAWRLRGVLVYLAVWQTTMFAIAVLCCDAPMLGRAFADALRQLFFITMFMCLASALLHAGRILDGTISDAVRESRLAATAEGRRAARDRVQMLVHDRIIVALLAHANGHPSAPNEARTALEEMRHRPQELAGDTTPQQLAWRLQALTTRLDPAVRFDYVFDGEVPVPADVAVAFEESLAEALRNSLRHAGRSVSRQVRASVRGDRIDVVVLDDGVGFDTERTDATRLGVRRGILHRMRTIDGGDAQVRSIRGYGTTVTLAWRRP